GWTLAPIDMGTPQEASPAYWAPFVVVGEGGFAPLAQATGCGQSRFRRVWVDRKFGVGADFPLLPRETCRQSISQMILPRCLLLALTYRLCVCQRSTAFRSVSSNNGIGAFLPAFDPSETFILPSCGWGTRHRRPRPQCRLISSSRDLADLDGLFQYLSQPPQGRHRHIGGVPRPTAIGIRAGRTASVVASTLCHAPLR